MDLPNELQQTIEYVSWDQYGGPDPTPGVAFTLGAILGVLISIVILAIIEERRLYRMSKSVPAERPGNPTGAG